MAEREYRFVLASASSGRLATLRRAGLDPDVVVSGVDEERVAADSPAALAATLAAAKCRTVADRLEADRPTLVLGCDSVLELDGQAHGKPVDADDARRRWRAMRGRAGVLHTGHCVRLLDRTAAPREAAATGSTRVELADVTDAEVDAYVATGEPLRMAGGFTIDGRGAPYVRRIQGDPHNVVGVSLPLLRDLLAGLGIAWHQLW